MILDPLHHRSLLAETKKTKTKKTKSHWSLLDANVNLHKEIKLKTAIDKWIVLLYKLVHVKMSDIEGYR